MTKYEEIEYKLKWLKEMLRTFIQHMNIKEDDFTLSINDLINIVQDVEEEISKIKQYHSLSAISVARELSLYCYYVLRRKPIITLGKENTYNINEKFCAFMLISSTDNIGVWNKDYTNFLISTLYRGELSKDALYLLVMTMYEVDKLGGKTDEC